MEHEYRRCAQCWKEEPEVELVEKTLRQNGEQTTRLFCKEGSCYGHYKMGLDS